MSIQAISSSNNYKKTNFTKKTNQQNLKTYSSRNTSNFNSPIKKVDSKLALAFLGLNGINSATKADNNSDKELQESIQATIEKAEELALTLPIKVSQIYRDSQKKAQEVTELYNKAQHWYYKGTAKVTGDTLEEFDSKGKLTRKTKFNFEKKLIGQRPIVKSIEEYHGDTRDIISFQQGEPSYYTKGREDFSDGSYKIDTRFSILYGLALDYFQDVKHFPDGSFSRGLYATMNHNGRPSIYRINSYQITDNYYHVESELYFVDGKPSQYSQDYTSRINFPAEYGHHLQFKDYKWQEIE